MKRSLVTTCLTAATICIAGIGSAYAAYAAQPAAARGARAAQHRMMDPVANAQKRLDALAAKLNLKPSQQDAWKAFSAAMLKHAEEHAREMKKHTPEERARQAGLATPEKLEGMAAHMRKAADHLSQLANDTKPFYEQLSPEQKTIFDLYAKNAWHNRMANRMPHHMH